MTHIVKDRIGKYSKRIRRRRSDKRGVKRRENQAIRIEGDRKVRTGDRKGVIDKSLPDILTTGQSLRILRLDQLS